MSPWACSAVLRDADRSGGYQERGLLCQSLSSPPVCDRYAHCRPGSCSPPCWRWCCHVSIGIGSGMMSMRLSTHRTGPRYHQLAPSAKWACLWPSPPGPSHRPFRPLSIARCPWRRCGAHPWASRPRPPIAARPRPADRPSAGILTYCHRRGRVIPISVQGAPSRELPSAFCGIYSCSVFSRSLPASPGRWHRQTHVRWCSAAA